MVIDTSAVLAILQDEPERRAFNEAIEAADSRSLSVASFVEASIVIEARFGAEGVRHLDRFLDRAGVTLVAVDVEQGEARASGLQPVRQGPPRGRAQLRRLLLLRARAGCSASRSCTRARISRTDVPRYPLPSGR